MYLQRIIVLLAFACITIRTTYAQCCSAGNPVASDVNFTITAKKVLKTELNYRYSESGSHYKNDSKLDINFMGKAYSNYSELAVAYGVFNRLEIRGDLGYFLNKTETYNFNNIPDSKGYGMGDLSIQSRYLIYKNFVRKWELSAGIGMKMPIGVFDQEYENVKLPINVQPSSGSYKYFVNAFFLKKLNDKFGCYTFSAIEIASKIDSKNFIYKYGNLYLLSIGCNHKASNKFNAGMQLRNEFREKSSRENDAIVDASGGYILYCLPSVSYNLFNSFYLSSILSFPVYGYYNDIQRSNKFSLNFKLTKSFNLCKNE